jgi:glutamate carboxypeptidase
MEESMAHSGEIIQCLDKTEAEMLTLLERLVNTDSGTYLREGVNQVAGIIGEKLHNLGFAVERLSQSEFGDHLLARKGGTSAKKLLCLGHMDTVFSEGEPKRRPFRIDGDKAYGPGALDMKGGIVVLLHSLYALMKVDPGLYKALNLTVLLNSEEEILSPTSTPHIIREAQAADTVCVFEPARPEGQVVIKRKGAGKYYLTVHGKAAHAGAQPELGVSAIEELAHTILEFHALNDFEEGLTVNVGVVRGGSRSNIIAEHAYAEIDVRVADEGQMNRVQKEFDRICRPHRDGIRMELTGGIVFPPMLKTERSLDLLRLFQETGKELGVDIDEIPTGGASDGNHASHYAPTIDGLGPQGTGAHGPDETLIVPTLIERSKVFALFIEKWHQSFAPKEDYPKGLSPLS